MAKEEVENMGEMKSRSWRESGKLLSKADPVTGSLEEHLLVYRVPRHWERLSHEDFVPPSSSSTTQAGEHDAKMLEDAEVDCADCVGERSLEGQVKGESYSEVSVDCNKDSS